MAKEVKIPEDGSAELEAAEVTALLEHNPFPLDGDDDPSPPAEPAQETVPPGAQPPATVPAGDPAATTPPAAQTPEPTPPGTPPVAQPGTPPAAQPVVEPQQPAPQVTPPAPAPAPAPAPPSAELTALQGQLQAQAALIAQLQQTIQAQTAAQPAQSVQAGPQIPGYDFDIPANIVEGISSEDPGIRKGAISMLVKGAAQAIHQQMAPSIREEIMGTVQTQIQSAQQEHIRNQDIFQDFYRNFPQLNNPSLRPLVHQAVTEVMRETGLTEWSDHLRTQIGARAIQKAQAMMQAVQPQGIAGAFAPTGVQTVPPQPVVSQGATVTPVVAGVSPGVPHQFGGNTTPQSSGSNNSVERQVRDMLLI